MPPYPVLHETVRVSSWFVPLPLAVALEQLMDGELQFNGLHVGQEPPHAPKLQVKVEEPPEYPLLHVAVRVSPLFVPLPVIVALEQLVENAEQLEAVHVGHDPPHDP